MLRQVGQKWIDYDPGELDVAFITCKKHGMFTASWHDHIKHEHGCHICAIIERNVTAHEWMYVLEVDHGIKINKMMILIRLLFRKKKDFQRWTGHT